MNILPTSFRSCGFDSAISKEMNPIKSLYPGMHSRDQKAHVLGLAIVSALGALLSGALLPFEFAVVLVPAFSVIAIIALARYCFSGGDSSSEYIYRPRNIVVEHHHDNPVIVPIHTSTPPPSSFWNWSSRPSTPNHTRYVPSWNTPSHTPVVTAPRVPVTTTVLPSTTVRSPGPAPTSTRTAVGFTRDTYDRTTGQNIPASSTIVSRAPAETYRPSTTSSLFSSSSHSAPSRSAAGSYTPSSFSGRAPAQTYTASTTNVRTEGR